MIYEEILKEMQAEFERLTGMEADRASDIGIRLKLLAGQLAGLEIKADYLLRQSLPQTATGKYLDMHAELRGIKRRQAAAALGELTFSRSLPAAQDIAIPEGTVCSTGPLFDIRFVTTREAFIPARGIKVSVPAQALNGGEEGCVAADAVSVMITPPQGVESVTNAEPFRGGEDAEDDASLRARLLESYLHISNGANKAFYRNIAMNCSDVKKAAVLPRVRGRGSVDVVVHPREGVDFDEISQRIQADLQEKREIGVDVLVRKAERVPVKVDVEIELAPGYAYQYVLWQVVRAIADYGDSLEIGGRITLAALGNSIFSLKGIANYKILQPQSDVSVGGDEIALLSLGALTQTA